MDGVGDGIVRDPRIEVVATHFQWTSYRWMFILKQMEIDDEIQRVVRI